MPRKKKSKYKKTMLELWRCGDCAFEWSYKTFRCPICSCMETTKIL